MAPPLTRVPDMLDILRKHASSWAIKVILGAIVISFIFFFGYSSMRRASRPGSAQEVATVNGRPISVAEYRFVLDSIYGSLRSSFGDKEVPDFVQAMARSQSLRQLVARELGLELARDLGVVVPDAELAEVIRKTPFAQRDGEFDPAFYRNQFLPYFRQRFGLDYEKFLKQDIEIDNLEGFFRGVDTDVPATEGGLGKGGTDFSWTFETVTFVPDELVEKGKVKSAEEARSAARLLVASDPARWKGLLAPLELSSVRTGPISLRERKTLLDGQGTIEDFTEIFSLTPSSPLVGEPIERGGKIYVIRLVERKEAGQGEGFWPARDFFRSWMAKLSEKAKVVSHLGEGE